MTVDGISFRFVEIVLFCNILDCINEIRTNSQSTRTQLNRSLEKRNIKQYIIKPKRINKFVTHLHLRQTDVAKAKLIKTHFHKCY